MGPELPKSLPIAIGRDFQWSIWDGFPYSPFVGCSKYLHAPGMTGPILEPENRFPLHRVEFSSTLSGWCQADAVSPTIGSQTRIDDGPRFAQEW